MKKSFFAVMALFISINMTAQNAPQLREDNIDEIIKAMTLEEKAKILVGGANSFFGDAAVVGGEADLVAGAAGNTAQIARLVIPATILTDGPAGVRINPIRKGDSNTYYATGFPIGTCLASTWNTDLVRNVGVAIGNETKEYHCDVILGPVCVLDSPNTAVHPFNTYTPYIPSLHSQFAVNVQFNIVNFHQSTYINAFES